MIEVDMDKRSSCSLEHLSRAFLASDEPPAALSYHYEFNSENDALVASATHPAPGRPASATPTTGNSLSPRAPKYKQKPTTSVSSSTISASELTPQQSSVLEEAVNAWVASKVDSPAFRSSKLDQDMQEVKAVLTMSPSFRRELATIIAPAATETNSARLAKWSSFLAKLPPIQRPERKLMSETSTFASALRNSILGGTAFATSPGGLAAIIARRAAPIETSEIYDFVNSGNSKFESNLDDSNMTPQEEAEFQLAGEQYDALIMSPEYEYVKDRLKEEPSDLPDVDDFWDSERSQKGKFNARLKSFLKAFPSDLYRFCSARLYKDITVTPMTPEQSAEVDQRIEDYLQSFVSLPEITSILAQLDSEELDGTATPPFASGTPFPTPGAGKSAVDALISSELNLVPTYAQPVAGSVIYGMMSIVSDVMNAPSTSGIPASTPASPEAASERPVTSASASTSTQSSSKPPTAHAKSDITQASIVSRTSAETAASTTSAVKKHVADTAQPEEASPTYYTSASRKGIFSAGVLAICGVVLIVSSRRGQVKGTVGGVHDCCVVGFGSEDGEPPERARSNHSQRPNDARKWSTTPSPVNTPLLRPLNLRRRHDVRRSIQHVASELASGTSAAADLFGVLVGGDTGDVLASELSSVFSELPTDVASWVASLTSAEASIITSVLGTTQIPGADAVNFITTGSGTESGSGSVTPTQTGSVSGTGSATGKATGITSSAKSSSTGSKNAGPTLGAMSGVGCGVVAFGAAAACALGMM
ncbi:uncharacterized protein PAC_07513 [Phialocephala subalpina]|uniref:Uncharacterized protein n=1 Tax=Phialocephala subalpina TaxID=576137 RepID=A0A1L7WXY5_9HELO|nr:uncharacterized protein PAC_07513 [Phialocephala subalpina]